MVQIGHACWQAGKTYKEDVEIPYMVLCQVKDLEELMYECDRLTCKGIEFELFHEPDFGIGYSALATKPLIEEKDRKVFRKLTLWKEPS